MARVRAKTSTKRAQPRASAAQVPVARRDARVQAHASRLLCKRGRRVGGTEREEKRGPLRRLSEARTDPRGSPSSSVSPGLAKKRSRRPLSPRRASRLAALARRNVFTRAHPRGCSRGRELPDANEASGEETREGAFFSDGEEDASEEQKTRSRERRRGDASKSTDASFELGGKRDERMPTPAESLHTDASVSASSFSSSSSSSSVSSSLSSSLFAEEVPRGWAASKVHQPRGCGPARSLKERSSLFPGQNEVPPEKLARSPRRWTPGYAAAVEDSDCTYTGAWCEYRRDGSNAPALPAACVAGWFSACARCGASRRMSPTLSLPFEGDDAPRAVASSLSRSSGPAVSLACACGPDGASGDAELLADSRASGDTAEEAVTRRWRRGSFGRPSSWGEEGDGEEGEEGVEGEEGEEGEGLRGRKRLRILSVDASGGYGVSGVITVIDEAAFERRLADELLRRQLAALGQTPTAACRESNKPRQVHAQTQTREEGDQEREEREERDQESEQEREDDRETEPPAASKGEVRSSWSVGASSASLLREDMEIVSGVFESSEALEAFADDGEAVGALLGSRESESSPSVPDKSQTSHLDTDCDPSASSSSRSASGDQRLECESCPERRTKARRTLFSRASPSSFQSLHAPGAHHRRMLCEFLLRVATRREQLERLGRRLAAVPLPQLSMEAVEAAQRRSERGDARYMSESLAGTSLSFSKSVAPVHRDCRGGNYTDAEVSFATPRREGEQAALGSVDARDNALCASLSSAPSTSSLASSAPSSPLPSASSLASSIPSSPLPSVCSGSSLPSSPLPSTLLSSSFLPALPPLSSEANGCSWGAATSTVAVDSGKCSSSLVKPTESLINVPRVVSCASTVLSGELESDRIDSSDAPSPSLEKNSPATGPVKQPFSSAVPDSPLFASLPSSPPSSLSSSPSFPSLHAAPGVGRLAARGSARVPGAGVANEETAETAGEKRDRETEASARKKGDSGGEEVARSDPCRGKRESEGGDTRDTERGERHRGSETEGVGRERERPCAGTLFDDFIRSFERRQRAAELARWRDVEESFAWLHSG
uniref:Uncharacterized protein n=1 Tax=Toxoplasma gondii COUG TaxID=1074873 RepID=A0A2G8XZI3_TOXGO|nr:hypothetical protein TGCOUG_286910 [Toxoplasma gondii COUG]